jgi:hypothetical protein
VVLIQTIKADPQMAKLIQNISSTNDGEQHKDNDINITQCFESNKDSILYLAETHYENLVETLTNNAVEATTYASPNPTLSSPQSSCTFPNLSNQSDTHRKESEIYDNSKGDIAE